jgi:hypothetical protein
MSRSAQTRNKRMGAVILLPVNCFRRLWRPLHIVDDKTQEDKDASRDLRGDSGSVFIAS